MFCPCDTGKTYHNCCKMFHDGVCPVHALSLMRSRYSAYALHMADYIIRTTHSDNPYYKSNHPQWNRELLDFSWNTKFQKLEILDFIDGAVESYVTFNAYLIQNDLNKVLVEKSHFVKVGEQWLYRNGVYIK